MIIYAVDDEPFALALLCDSLRAVVPDAEIHDFQNPLMLLEAAEKVIPDVAFLDIEMRQMTGLELARRLTDISSSVNIIFVTGYSQYMGEAFDLFASGYLQKPVREDAIQQQMRHLRYTPVNQSGIFARTFGAFDLLVGDSPVHFRRAKSKELLAYLIDRRGAAVPRTELASVLFNDDVFTRSQQNYLSILARTLEEDLDAAGADHLFFRQASSFWIDTKRFSCDLYDCLNGNSASIHLFRGKYMDTYPWASETLKKLKNRSGQ